MDKDAIEDELLSPTNLKNDLIYFGLKQIEIDINELLLAEEYGKKYRKLSRYDRIALAIAKNRKIILLTGDKRLRNAAKEELVEVIWTLGILDRLYEFQLITLQEYNECLENLKKQNGKIMLPIMEIETRLNKNNF